jgi:parvulin-like peptidyl-prolyl isomerase
MNRILLSLIAASVLALGASACGSSGGSSGGATASLQSADVAVVGPAHITKDEFNQLMSQAKRSYTTQKRTFPKAGTPEWDALKNQAVQFLVQRAEYDQQAADMGLKIDDKQVDAKLAQIKKSYFGGSAKKYQAELKKQGLTETQVRADIRSQLVSQAIFNKVTKDVKVSDKDIQAYYTSHKSQYGTPETRDIRHILVKSKTLANTIYDQLQAGGDFCKLAKKYSQDPSSKSQCGKLTITKGQTVPPFDQTAFLLDKGKRSRPIHTQYGYHIIEALSDTKPAKTTPLKDVKASIQQQLAQTKKNTAMQTWVNGINKDYKSKIKYQVGYTPPAPAATTTGSTTG